MKSTHEDARCLNCLQRFCFDGAKAKMEEHFKTCQGITGGCQTVKLPEKDTVLKFKDYSWMHRLPYVVYLDFETTNKEEDKEDGQPDIKIEKIWNQTANSYSFVVVDYEGKVIKEVMYNEVDEGDIPVAEHCILELKKIAIELQPSLNQFPEHNLTTEEEATFQSADKCYMCGEGDFDEELVKYNTEPEEKGGPVITEEVIKRNNTITFTYKSS